VRQARQQEAGPDASVGLRWCATAAALLTLLCVVLLDSGGLLQAPPCRTHLGAKNALVLDTGCYVLQQIGLGLDQALWRLQAARRLQRQD